MGYPMKSISPRDHDAPWDICIPWNTPWNVPWRKTFPWGIAWCTMECYGVHHGLPGDTPWCAPGTPWCHPTEGPRLHEGVPPTATCPMDRALSSFRFSFWGTCGDARHPPARVLPAAEVSATPLANQLDEQEARLP